MNQSKFAPSAFLFVFGLSLALSATLIAGPQKENNSQALTLKQFETQVSNIASKSELIESARITGHNLLTIKTSAKEAWQLNASISDDGQSIRLIFPCRYVKEYSRDQLHGLLNGNVNMQLTRFELYGDMIHLTLPIENRRHEDMVVLARLELLYLQAQHTREIWNASDEQVVNRSKTPVANVGVAPTSAADGDHAIPRLVGEQELQKLFDQKCSQDKVVEGRLQRRDGSSAGRIVFEQGGDLFWFLELPDYAKTGQTKVLEGTYQINGSTIVITNSNDQVIKLPIFKKMGSNYGFQNPEFQLGIELKMED